MIITIITIINYNYSSNHLSALYILAEPDNNNNDNKEEKEGEENKETRKK